MIKTVSLTADVETKVEISGGYNVGVINRTTGMLYASRNSGISAGADDVAAIPAGDSYVIRAADDTVYLLATAAGDVQLESIGAKEVFKMAAARSSSGGGGTVDEVARQAIASHANNADIHLTAEKAIEAAATTISNPNLLTNGDFRINHIGKDVYDNTAGTGSMITVDGWRVGVDGKVTPLEGGGILLETNGGSTGSWILYQRIENIEELIGEQVTISIGYEDCIGQLFLKSSDGVNTDYYPSSRIPEGSGVAKVTYDVLEGGTTFSVNILRKMGEAQSIKMKWIKLEVGSVATPFIRPDPALELLRCQRYMQLHTTGDIAAADLRPSMRIAPSVSQLDNGLYLYNAFMY